jgi:hypothetical protein
MNEIYPYSTPIIMTDDIFDAHGGDLNGSKPALRQIAFTIAEDAVTDDVGTFLLRLQLRTQCQCGAVSGYKAGSLLLCNRNE